MKLVRIRLLGAFAVFAADGTELTPKSRKSQALLAMLCTGRDGKRTRAWLQARLWSDRAPTQASGSLRSCLHEVRTVLGDLKDVIIADRAMLQLDLSSVTVDVRDMTPLDWLNSVSAGAEFLEGLDIADNEFNHWLAEQRLHWARRAELPHVPAHPAPQQAEHPDVPPVAALPEWDLSLSVLPLENRTGDMESRYAGQGLSDDLVNRLQRLRWLPVIRPPDIAGNGADAGRSAIMENIGARYFVEGSVQKEGNSRQAHFRLTETESDRVLWSNTYQLEQFKTHDAANALFDEVVGAIDRTVQRSFQRSVLSAPAQASDVQDQIWRGRFHVARLTREDSDLAMEYFKKALALQPNSPEAQIQMAFWHLWRTWVSRDGEAGLNAAEHYVRLALELDPDDGRCFAILGIAEAWRRNHESAIAYLRESLELNPNLAIAHHQLGSALVHSDRPEDAINPLLQAMQYSPRDQLDFAFQTEMAVALARTDAFEEAYVRATRALMMKPRYWYGHLVRILVAERLGDKRRLGEARRAYEQAGVQIDPNDIEWLPFRSDDWPNQLKRVVG